MHGMRGIKTMGLLGTLLLLSAGCGQAHQRSALGSAVGSRAVSAPSARISREARSSPTIRPHVQATPSKRSLAAPTVPRNTAKTTSATSAPSSRPATSSPWMSEDQKARSVTLRVVAGFNNVNGGYNFDGAANGAMTVRVPSGWHVTVDFHNQSLFSHSLAIVANGHATTAAFPGASLPTADLTAGINQGDTVQFHFVAGTPGTYRMACLVPSHEAAGMWARFVVTPQGAPSVSIAHRS